MNSIQTHLEAVPLLAILRGLQPEQAQAVGQALYDNGVKLIEVPLNRPNAFAAIENLVQNLPSDAVIGAGTVTEPAQLERLASLGGKFAVSPHYDIELIEQAQTLDLEPMPGIFTPTEAMTAARAGAKYLKLFPASSLSPDYVKAINVILPETVHLLAVGGVTANNLKQWLEAGVIAAGVGNGLYCAGDTSADIAQKVAGFLTPCSLSKS